MSHTPDTTNDQDTQQTSGKNPKLEVDTDIVPELPKFNSRPLSDTPVASTVTSPMQSLYSPLDEESGTSSDTEADANLSIAKLNTLKNKDIPVLDLDNSLSATSATTGRQKLATTLDIPGQTRSKVSPDGHIAKRDVGSKLVIVMVGLPARGKSYITNKLTRYLNWLQHNCQVFNVGNTRRRVNADLGPEKKPLPDSPSQNDSGNTSPDSMHPHTTTTPPDQHSSTKHKLSFFSPDNKLTTALREKWAMDTLDELLDSLIDGDLSVGIFDATNSTKARRLKILNRIMERSNGELKVLFLESICSDPSIIHENVRLKLSGPDYKDMDPKLALEDFYGRLKNYERAYEAIGDDEEKIKSFSYIKMIDVGKKVVTFNVEGFLASQTVYFLLNFNLLERQIWITRHGESVDNVLGRIGGDAPLTERGQNFAKCLSKFMLYKKQEFRKLQLERFKTKLEVKIRNHESNGKEAIPEEPLFTVWSSMLKRSIETVEYFPEDDFFVKEMRMLDELGAGRCDGMTYPEIQMRYPQDYKSRLNNKMSYRYPGVGGESYLDVINRLRPVITEIERCTDHVLLVTHRVVSRVLLGYFLNLDKSLIGDLDVPLHTVYCLEPKPYGVDYALYEYDEAKDWFRKVDLKGLNNLKKVEQVNISFKERQYSVIPTLPSGHVFKKIGNSSYTDSVQRSRGVPSNNVPQSALMTTSTSGGSLEVDKLTEKLKHLHNSGINHR